MSSIHDLLSRRSASSGPALIEGCSGRSVTWGEVAGLCEQWQRPEHLGPTGLALSDPLAMAAHLVAALACGAVVAPLDPAAPARDTAARVRELGLSRLVTDGSSPLHPRRVDLGRAFPLPETPRRPALIMASSGSTGPAKTIPLTADQLLATASGVAGHLHLGPGQRGYSPLPLFHINGIVVGLLSTLVADASLVIDARFSRSRFWGNVNDRDVTWINAVPAVLAILAGGEDHGEPPARQIRLARSASAPLPEAVRRRFEARYSIPVVETYGMTEAASQITANPLRDLRPGSVGRPVGVEVRVVDTEGRPVAAGDVGRVQIRGAAVVDTYWLADGGGRMQAREATDAEGWMTTGDVGRTDGDGYLYLTGREGEIINRGGEKIRPREVEEVLLGDERVRAAVVVGRRHPTVGEEPVAYVEPAEDADTSPDRLARELTDRCRRQLSSFKRPASIEVVRGLPAGPTGKIRRAEVGRMANPEPARPRRIPSGEPSRESVFLSLPERQAKPRRAGLTMAIDNGIPHGVFADAIRSAAPYIDVVKFGWGTVLVTPEIDRKFEVLNDLGIGYYFGGTLFEKFALQDRFESWITLCRLCECRYVEISDGTVTIAADARAGYIRRCVEEGFTVLSEVGSKDASRSDELGPDYWVGAIRADLAAGATMVITEARESGRSGLCHRDGTPRLETLDAICDSGIDPGRLIFEAPNKDLQTHFISRFGPDVNLGNIAPADVIGLETLRLGLRSDTLLNFERVDACA